MLEQLDALWVEAPGEANAVIGGKTPVGVETDDGAAPCRMADQGDAGEVGPPVLADLDLEGSEALGEPLLHLGLDGAGLGRVEGRQQRQAHVVCQAEKGVVLQHFHRRDQGRGGDRALVLAQLRHGLSLSRAPAHHKGCEPLAEFEAAGHRLVGITGRNVAFAPGAAALGVPGLHQDRVEILIDPVGHVIGHGERQVHQVQGEAGEVGHGSGSGSGGGVAALRRRPGPRRP